MKRAFSSKKTFAIVSLFMALSVFFVLSSFGTAHADHHFKITNSYTSANYDNSCRVTIKFTNGEIDERHIGKTKTEDWKTSRCLQQITGSCSVATINVPMMVAPVMYQNICTDASYEIKWVEADKQTEFVRTK